METINADGTRKVIYRPRALSDQEHRSLGLEDDHMGLCPECHHTDGYTNVGKAHWFFCRHHHKKWCSGVNLFSSWQHETEEEQRRQYERIGLDRFEEVEPYFHPREDAAAATHRYPVGCIVYLVKPGPEPRTGRFADGSLRGCTVQSHLGHDDSGRPVYLVNDGIVHNEIYELEAAEDELVFADVGRALPEDCLRLGPGAAPVETDDIPF